MHPLIARFMGPIWGPSGSNRTQVGPMLSPQTLLSGWVKNINNDRQIPAICLHIKQIYLSADLTHDMIITSLGSSLQQMCLSTLILNTLRLRQNGRHFTDNIFKSIFLNYNLNFKYISLKYACPLGSNSQYVIISLENGLALNRQQAIIWTNQNN